MNEVRMKEIEKAIDDLIVDLLTPIRANKTIYRRAFDKLYVLLDELKELLKEEPMINRKLAGLLFFIYTSVSDEAAYTDYKSPVFQEAGRLGTYLDEILDSPLAQ